MPSTRLDTQKVPDTRWKDLKVKVDGGDNAAGLINTDTPHSHELHAEWRKETTSLFRKNSSQLVLELKKQQPTWLQYKYVAIW